MAHHVIYLPGLGDNHARGQTQIINWWRLFGLIAHFQPLNWADGEPFQPKLQRVLSFLDDLKAQGHTVSVVGVSAGASAALNAYLARPGSINAVVYVCGKLSNPQTVNPRYYRENPAFQESLMQAQTNLQKLSSTDKAKMLSLYPLYDTFVPPNDSKIPGVKGKTILAPGHIPSIFMAITLYGGIISHHLKSRVEKS